MDQLANLAENPAAAALLAGAAVFGVSSVPWGQVVEWVRSKFQGDDGGHEIIIDDHETPRASMLSDYEQGLNMLKPWLIERGHDALFDAFDTLELYAIADPPADEQEVDGEE